MILLINKALKLHRRDENPLLAITCIRQLAFAALALRGPNILWISKWHMTGSCGVQNPFFLMGFSFLWSLSLKEAAAQNANLQGAEYFPEGV